MFRMQHRYAQLPHACFATCSPSPVSTPWLIAFNHELAAQLGADGAAIEEQLLANIFSGNHLLANFNPIAMNYCGHQFGQLNPQLGDGRAMLLGEIITPDNRIVDLQLKGAGRTPYSRNGDGRSPLGPVLREYLVSEAMHALGVPTTRALAAVLSGDTVYRDSVQPGAVFTRVASSHIRIGTLQYFAMRQDTIALTALADLIIERHYPDLAEAGETRYLAMFQRIIERQAELIAWWMQLGFIHGVMNTDNMTVSGETIDYGPCAFIDEYKASTVYSAIDRRGRYAFQNQPAIGQWNLTRLAEALLPLLPGDQAQGIELAQTALARFQPHYEQAWLTHMRQKCGWFSTQSDDGLRIEQLLTLLEAGRIDYTLFFRTLARHAAHIDVQASAHDWQPLLALCHPDAERRDTDQVLQIWLHDWAQRCIQDARSAEQRSEQMLRHNPAYIPRNHRIADVIRAAEDDHDFAPFYTLLTVLQSPYTEQPNYQAYQQPPEAQQRVLRTFCGT